jgi:hypothetical protein
MHALFVLAQVSVNPDGGALPGTPQLQSLVNGLAFWGLLACVAVLLAGAAFWAGGSRASNYGAVANGKNMVFSGAVGAALIGGAAAIVNFFYGVGQGVS